MRWFDAWRAGVTVRSAVRAVRLFTNLSSAGMFY